MRGKPGASEETREELLQAGLRILLRDGLAPGINLKLTDVVKEANRSTGAAYQIWKSQEDFRLELAVHATSSVEYADPSVLATVLEEALAEGRGLYEIVEAVGRSYFEHLVSRPEFYLTLHFWAAAENLSAEVRSAIEDGYSEIQSSFEAFFEFVFAIFEVEVRSPQVLTDLTTAATAITEGMALRFPFATSDAERQRLTELYVDMLTALMPAMLERTSESG